MATVRTLIGNIKGPKGDTGATGATGPQGPGATIEVGTVSTTAYGNPVQITNSGTETDAVLDFVIPQGKPGEQTTKMSLLTLDTITTQTAEYPVPAVGDVGSTAWGKIVKFFNDIKTAVTGKVDTTSIVNNLTSTSTDKPLSAAQGKALNDAKASTAELNAVDAKHSNYSAVEFSRIAYYQNKFTFRKIGRLVEVSYAGSSAAQSAQADYVELGTLPNAFSPLGTVFIMLTPANASGSNSAVLQITPAGVINTYNFNKAVTSGAQYRIQVHYIAKDYSVYSA